MRTLRGDCMQRVPRHALLSAERFGAVTVLPCFEPHFLLFSLFLKFMTGCRNASRHCLSLNYHNIKSRFSGFQQEKQMYRQLNKPAYAAVSGGHFEAAFVGHSDRSARFDSGAARAVPALTRGDCPRASLGTGAGVRTAAGEMAGAGIGRGESLRSSGRQRLLGLPWSLAVVCWLWLNRVWTTWTTWSARLLTRRREPLVSGLPGRWWWLGESLGVRAFHAVAEIVVRTVLRVVTSMARAAQWAIEVAWAWVETGAKALARSGAGRGVLASTQPVRSGVMLRGGKFRVGGASRGQTLRNRDVGQLGQTQNKLKRYKTGMFANLANLANVFCSPLAPPRGKPPSVFNSC